jgi:hypothetical protein
VVFTSLNRSGIRITSILITIFKKKDGCEIIYLIGRYLSSVSVFQSLTAVLFLPQVLVPSLPEHGKYRYFH